MEMQGGENKVIYPKLSYEIVGALFDVWAEIGWSHKEKYIQRAVAEALNARGLHFREQVKVGLYYRQKKVGVYFLDFLIEEKIVLEIKKREYYSGQDIKQVYGYLKATNLKLGLITHFTSKGVKFKRILNLK